MNFYPEKINERFKNPQNAGNAEGANAGGASAAFVCGAVLRLSLRIDAETKEILEAKFKTSGCGYSIAAAEVLTKKIIGRKLTEFHGSEKSALQAEIETELGIPAENRRHCFELILDALPDAFRDFRHYQIEEFTGERALVCTCFGVSEEEIEKAIAGKGIETVEEVGEACRAGTGCGACQPLIQEIIDTKYDIFN